MSKIIPSYKDPTPFTQLAGGVEIITDLSKVPQSIIHEIEKGIVNGQLKLTADEWALYRVPLPGLVDQWVIDDEEGGDRYWLDLRERVSRWKSWFGDRIALVLANHVMTMGTPFHGPTYEEAVAEGPDGEMLITEEEWDATYNSVDGVAAFVKKEFGI